MSVVRKQYVSVMPVRAYLHPARDENPNRTCTWTQVVVADVIRTSAPRHTAGVRMWLNETTEWVGGWGVCMSVWVGVGASATV